MEIFHLEKNGGGTSGSGSSHKENEGGTFTISDRFRRPLAVRPDHTIYAQQKDGRASVFTMEVTADGTKEAVNLARTHKKVILALGSCPMIGAKEEIDRKTIMLPSSQQKLIDQVTEVNENVLIVFITNYPYSFMEGGKTASGLPGDLLQEGVRRAKAILWSASGSQDMGTALARTIFGLSAPAGRTNETWYKRDDQLPDINDYDIIKGRRTYRYFDGEVIWPFGFGLTYTDFTYRNLSLAMAGPSLVEASFEVTNTGSAVSGRDSAGPFPDSDGRTFLLRYDQRFNDDRGGRLSFLCRKIERGPADTESAAYSGRGAGKAGYSMQNPGRSL